jgi:hypothetical protein
MSQQDIAHLARTELGRVETQYAFLTSPDEAFDVADKLQSFLQKYKVYTYVNVRRHQFGPVRDKYYYAITCSPDLSNVSVDILRGLSEEFLTNESDNDYASFNWLLNAKHIPYNFIKMPDGRHVWTKVM